MEKKEGDKEDRFLELKQLKEMSLLSIAHTPASDMDEIIKIIKNFFGVYFDIKYEFTYSELIDIANSYGLDEHPLNQLTEYVNRLKQMLYIKQTITDSDLEYIKSGITKLITELVPDTVSQPVEKKHGLLEGILPHRHEKAASAKPVFTAKALDAQQHAQIKPKRVDKRLLELETQIAGLEKQIADANPFIKLELESLKGDLGLYKADPSTTDPTTLFEKLNTLKGRI